MHYRGVKSLSQRVTARGGAGAALALRGQGMGKERHHEAGTGLSPPHLNPRIRLLSIRQWEPLKGAAWKLVASTCHLGSPPAPTDSVSPPTTPFVLNTEDRNSLLRPQQPCCPQQWAHGVTIWNFAHPSANTAPARQASPVTPRPDSPPAWGGKIRCLFLLLPGCKQWHSHTFNL